MSQEPRKSPATRTVSSPPVPYQSKSEQQQQQQVAASDDLTDLESGLLDRRGRQEASTSDIPTATGRPEPEVANLAGRKISASSSSSSSSSKQRRRLGQLPGAPVASTASNAPERAGQKESTGLLGLKQQDQKLRRRPRGSFINPSGSVCYWWSAVVSLAFLYNFWSTSYRFAFREIDSATWPFWFSSDIVAELIYCVDIYINSKMGYLEDGVLQRDPKKIKAHYYESNLMYLDSFCVLPFDMLYFAFGYNSILRCNRLVKAYKFWSFVDRTERHTNYPNLFRTVTLVHNILVIFHWNACFFHMISTHKIIDIDGLLKLDEDHCNDTTCQYLHAFYWSTLSIIGGLPRPRTKSEYIFVIVELIFGIMLFAWVMGHVANIVTNVSAARKEFQARLDAVKTFMRTRRVSDELQTKVIRWFDYLWNSQKSTDEERSVACLPDRLKAEMAIHVNLDTLKRVDIFQATEVGFLRELVLRLKPVLFSPGDYVCRKDEAGHEMYIVSRGILEVVTNEGQTVVATFTAGSYFGEIAVLNVGSAGNKRTASVRSVGYSDLFCLSKQDLWDVLKDYPQAEARIRAVAEERLSALEERVGGARQDPQRGPLPPGASQRPQRLVGGAATGVSSTSLLAQHYRRSSQRSSRGRVQPAGSDSWQNTAANTAPTTTTTTTTRNIINKSRLDCLGAGLPPSEPGAVRLRPYGSASSHRSCTSTATGTQLPGRKCLNSRTMEPICANSAAAAAAQMMLGPAVYSEPATQVRHCHHHHCGHAAACGLFCQLREPGEPNAPPPPPRAAQPPSSRSSGQQLIFPPASPRQPGQAGPHRQHHHLSIQQPAHLGQSRSFECSPLGLGERGHDELPRVANRSRSGALVLASPRGTPPQTTSDDNQTLIVEQAAASLDGGSGADVSLATARQSLMLLHRPHLCLHQEAYSLQPHQFQESSSSSSAAAAATCRVSQLRGRSSSMTTRPVCDERELGDLVDDHLDDDDFGCDDGDVDEDYDEYERDEAANLNLDTAYEWVQRPVARDTRPRRQQRHKQECRHHQHRPVADGGTGHRQARQTTSLATFNSGEPHPLTRPSPYVRPPPLPSDCSAPASQQAASTASSQPAGGDSPPVVAGLASGHQQTTTATAQAPQVDQQQTQPLQVLPKTSDGQQQLVVESGAAEKTAPNEQQRRAAAAANINPAQPPPAATESASTRWSSRNSGHEPAQLAGADSTSRRVEMGPGEEDGLDEGSMR